jgi:TRAP-type C4-dicarboxylate transport system permease small subunit
MNRPIEKARRAALAAMEVVCVVALWSIVALLGLSGLERNLARTAFIGNNDDLVGYGMAALFAFGLAIALADRGHVNVDLLYRRYGPRLRRIADLAFMCAGVLAALGLTLGGLALAYDSLSRGRINYGMIELPLWLPQLMIPVGGFLFMLEFLADGRRK